MTQSLYTWPPRFTKFPTLELSLVNGGFFSCKFGGISLVPNAFDGPPPSKRVVDIRYGPASALSIPLYFGTIKLDSDTETSLEYSVYEAESDVNLLSDGADHEGNDCVIPVCVGTVQYMRLQRTGTDIEHRFYTPNFAGTLGTDWHIYDEGVQIDSHWTINPDGTMLRSVSIIGEATASGTADMTTLKDFFEWACNEDRLNVEFINHHDIAETIEIDYVFYSQAPIYQEMGQIAYYCGHSFFLSEDIYTQKQNINLISLDEANGEASYNIFHMRPPVYQSEYIRTYTATWKIYLPEETDVDPLILYGDSPEIGEDRNLDKIYNYVTEKISTRMQWVLDYEQLQKVEITVPLTRMPACGEKIILNDTSRQYGSKNGYFIANMINLDPGSNLLKIGGRWIEDTP